MPATWIIAAAAVISAGTGAYAAASAPGMPKPPNAAGATRAGVEADAQTLADRRRLEAAARLGQRTDYTVPEHKEKREFVKVPNQTYVDRQGVTRVKNFKTVPYVPEEWDQGGKYYKETASGQPIKPKTFKQNVKVAEHIATADFGGFGDADVQGQLARENAANVLALEKKYGKDFIAEALKQQELADPEGTKARKLAYDLIQQQINDKPERPVGDLLDTQVGEQLKAGKGLDRISREALDRAISQSMAARGDTGEGANFEEPLTTGFAGEQRAAAGRAKALQWLASGATPEDVAYRREQQNLANLSAFVGGQTPQSQFATLSGAQNGPAPYVTARPLPQMNPNAGAAGQNFALQSWQTQMGQAANNVSPWLAGLTGLISAGSAFAGGAGGGRQGG